MTLAKKTFLLFFSVYMLQIALFGVLLFIGYQRSERQYREARDKQAEQIARQILTTSSESRMPFSGQLVVYDADGNLIFQTRGMGMQGAMAQYHMAGSPTPIYENQEVLGYYVTAPLGFREDAANQTFLDSMTNVLIASLALSLVITIVVALSVSRTVSKPADRLATKLSRMTKGDLDGNVETGGAEELVRIGTSIEQLRQRLLKERILRFQWSQDLAHDLRTPVASVKAQLEGMADGILPVTPTRFEKAMRELKRMELLINDLELLMHLESPEMSIVRTKINVQTFIGDAIGRFETSIAAKSIHVSSVLACDWIVADEALLLRALSNVLSNAVRHCTKGGQILLSVSKEKDGIHLSVQNTGTPIPANEIGKVFDRLYRGEFARNSPGSGLGLTIAERIIRLHGGSISITSTAETGTIVMFLLPQSAVGGA